LDDDTVTLMIPLYFAALSAPGADALARGCACLPPLCRHQKHCRSFSHCSESCPLLHTVLPSGLMEMAPATSVTRPLECWCERQPATPLVCGDRLVLPHYMQCVPLRLLTAGLPGHCLRICLLITLLSSHISSGRPCTAGGSLSAGGSPTEFGPSGYHQ